MARIDTNSDPDYLMTEEQAATFLTLSPRTLQAWRITDAGPPFVRAGRAIRYRRRDVVAWVEAHTVISRAGLDAR